MASPTTHKREITVGDRKTTYLWTKNKEDITVKHQLLNEFRCLSLERADAVVTHALAIKWRYPDV